MAAQAGRAMVTAGSSGAYPSGPSCPLHTATPNSPLEQANPGAEGQEIRAYKLGKKRWSYNQVELILGGRRRVVVQQAVHANTDFPSEYKESAVCFVAQLKSGQKLQVHIYIVYDQPLGPTPDQAEAKPSDEPEAKPSVEPSSVTPDEAEVKADDGPSAPDEAGNSASAAPAAASSPEGSATTSAPKDSDADAGTDSNVGNVKKHVWRLVTRSHCHRKCAGPILRSIQRFGRLGKRSWSDTVTSNVDGGSSPDLPNNSVQLAACSMKDPRYMYLSLDEACTHVNAPGFRLVAGVYDLQGTRLLTTAVSPPIRVFANNDVPTGAARIPLEANLPADWEGWEAEEAAVAAPAASGRSSSPRLNNRRKLSLRVAGSGRSNQSDTPSPDIKQESKPPEPKPQPKRAPPPKAAQEVAPVPVPPVDLVSLLGGSMQPQPVTSGVSSDTVQLMQQWQQQQILQQLLQQQQVASAWQQQQQHALGVEQLAQVTQQLSQLLQLLQVIGGGANGGGNGLGQSLLFPPPLLNAPAPAYGSLLGGLLPSLGGLGGSSQGQLSSSHLISMLLSSVGANVPSPAPALAPASTLAPWAVAQGLPLPPNLPPNLPAMAASLMAMPGSAQSLPPPVQPANLAGEAEAQQPNASAQEPASEAMQVSDASAGQQMTVPLAKLHSTGALPTPKQDSGRDAPMNAMAMLANLAAAAAGT